MWSRWLAYSLNTLIQITLIQQPEPSGSEAGESRVRNMGREIWPTKHLTHALYGSFTDGFTSLPLGHQRYVKKMLLSSFVGYTQQLSLVLP
jgi:hypothetical protein